MLKEQAQDTTPTPAVNATGTGRRGASKRSPRKLIAFGWYGGKFSHLDFLAPLFPLEASPRIPSGGLEGHFFSHTRALCLVRLPDSVATRGLFVRTALFILLVTLMAAVLGCATSSTGEKTSIQPRQSAECKELAMDIIEYEYGLAPSSYNAYFDGVPLTQAERDVDSWRDLGCGRMHPIEQRYLDAWRLIASDVFPYLASPPPRGHPRTGNSPQIPHQRGPQSDTTVFLVDDDHVVEGQCRIEMTNRDGSGWSFYFPVEHLIPGQYGRGLYNNVVERERQRLFVGIIRQEVDHDTGGDSLCLTPGQILQQARGFGPSECNEIQLDLLYYEKQGMPVAQRDTHLDNQKRLSELKCVVASVVPLAQFDPGADAAATYSPYVPLEREAQPNISIGLSDDEPGQCRIEMVFWHGGGSSYTFPETRLSLGQVGRPSPGAYIQELEALWSFAKRSGTWSHRGA